jgi:tetratricopeptide (TPR) repeat protein
LQLDPRGAEIASDLANLYMELNRGTEAIAAGEQALKIDPQNQEAHRILGMVYASRTPLTANNNRTTDAQRENLTKAIQHLEQSIRGPMAQADANTRALLSRPLHRACRSRQGDSPCSRTS